MRGASDVSTPVKGKAKAAGDDKAKAAGDDPTPATVWNLDAEMLYPEALRVQILLEFSREKGFVNELGAR